MNKPGKTLKGKYLERGLKRKKRPRNFWIEEVGIEGAQVQKVQRRCQDPALDNNQPA